MGVVWVRLAFYQPDIPQNLGGAIRLAACFDTPIDIIEPCGFPLTTKALKRAAMDYGALANTTRHASWSAFLTHPGVASCRRVLFTTKGEDILYSHSFVETDVLLFGSESSGAPEAVHAAADARLRIPIASPARSLNVVVAAAIALSEAVRQCGALASSPAPGSARSATGGPS